MHKPGDLVLWSTGVMKIADIREESYFGTLRTYYVLINPKSKSDSETLIPTDNGELVSKMRPLLPRDELLRVISEAKKLPPEKWIAGSRARAEAYNKIILSGDRGRLITMIRAIGEASTARRAEGKKSFVSDDNLRRKAEKLLFSEVSAVCGIPEEQAADLIKSL